MDSVEDDREAMLECAQAPRVVLRLADRVRPLVTHRGLDVQGATERIRGDQLSQTVDRRVVAVGQPDLKALGNTGE